jgi:hypothetical protein
MIDPTNVPVVTEDEIVARFVLSSNHVRRADSTLKPDAFIPHPHLDLSVTRHRSATEDELWSIGDGIARERERTLYGRGDVVVSAFIVRSLTVKAKPIPGNPNHADICDWPIEKSAQKNIAQQIAAEAAFVARHVADG